MRSAPKRPTIPVAVRWAINDQQKFADLVQHLKDFIDDLESLTEGSTVSRRQGQFIQVEVESIRDVSELEMIEQANMDRRDQVADAAGLRIFQLQHHNNSTPNGNAETGIPTIDWEVVPKVANPPDGPVETYHQTLYRVTCELQPTATFFDEPTYDPGNGVDSQWLVVDGEIFPKGPAALHLSGSRPLRDLDSYVEHNSQLWWLVVVDYICCHDIHNDRKAEPTTSSIQLTSQVLCDELNNKTSSLTVKSPTFTPGMVLSQPYHWFYYNRQDLLKPEKDPWHEMFPMIADNIILCNLPATEPEYVIGTLLEYIQHSMADEYRRVPRLGFDTATLKTIPWALLSLIFVSPVTHNHDEIWLTDSVTETWRIGRGAVPGWRRRLSCFFSS